MAPIIYYRHDSIFDQPYDLLVNPINARAVSGKGLALEFKRRYPDNQRQLEVVINEFGTPEGGDVIALQEEGGQMIANFVTKVFWRNPSELEFVTLGMHQLAKVVRNYPVIRSVAIPALGAGLGGLRWETVEREVVHVIHEAFPPNVVVYLFPPQ